MVAAQQEKPNWFAQVRACGVEAIARELGMLDSSGRHPAVRPCPSCEAKQRGFTKPDRRSPLWVNPNGITWRCVRPSCGAYGDAVTLAVLSLTGVQRPAPAGWKTVREWCEGHGFCDPEDENAPRKPRPPPPEPTEVVLPTARELRDITAACVACDHDDEVASWMRSRAILPEAVASLKLAAALRRDSQRVRWAHFQGVPWQQANLRVLVPMYDHTGRLRSMRARRPGPGEPKSVSAVCGPGSQRGLVMACQTARALMRRDATPEEMGVGELWVFEGEVDFFSGAEQLVPDGNKAVLGVVEGSWTKEIAESIPSGLTVVIATDDEDSGVGDKYAAHIAETLAPRAKQGLLRLKRLEARKCSKT